jgi:methionine biosynthesis protein MetW
MIKKTLEKIENYYHGYDPVAEKRAKTIFSFLRYEKKTKKILDCGCGNGLTLNFLKLNNFKELYGVDISSKCLKECRKKGIKNLKKVNLEEEKLPYRKNSFDIVICSEVFEHLFNPHIALQEIKRVLKDNGFAIFSFPNELNLRSRIRILFGGEIHDPLAVGSHIRFFKPNTIRKFLNLNGFEVEKMEGFYLENKIYKFFPFISFLSKKIPSLFARTIFVKAIKK